MDSTDTNLDANINLDIDNSSGHDVNDVDLIDTAIPPATILREELHTLNANTESERELSNQVIEACQTHISLLNREIAFQGAEMQEMQEKKTELITLVENLAFMLEKLTQRNAALEDANKRVSDEQDLHRKCIKASICMYKCNAEEIRTLQEQVAGLKSENETFKQTLYTYRRRSTTVSSPNTTSPYSPMLRRSNTTEAIFTDTSTITNPQSNERNVQNNMESVRDSETTLNTNSPLASLFTEIHTATTSNNNHTNTQSEDKSENTKYPFDPLYIVIITFICLLFVFFRHALKVSVVILLLVNTFLLVLLLLLQKEYNNLSSPFPVPGVF
eukprot:TRINITY_DN3193_c0_g2_i1.p1 TRINITY_DN3193_c0_g2~~TRINITY_DN3193_c0_g2_i1.p1  ORF type:complete len:330 (-),score=55.15 TRINITY_DN3193_c0_g2_i1:153-1142(-)